MGVMTYIVLTASILVGVSAVTGWWRLSFAPFRLSRKRMNVDRLGLCFTSTRDVQHVNRLFESFLGGFNSMICGPSWQAWQRFAGARPSLYSPFAQEGAAMGYMLRHLGRFNPEEFERSIVQANPNFRYLHYVGLGFWSGIRNHHERKMKRIVDRLDPLYRYLCYDGYGFKQSFFGTDGDSATLASLDKFDGYAKNAAYHGVGRALWFRCMPQVDLLIERLTALGDFAGDAAAGVGLASVFVNPDRLGEARGLALQLPPNWHDQFHLGMCFGLKARSISDPKQFEIDLSRIDSAQREAIWASIHACDRIEAQVRQEKLSYREWRAGVRDWMRSHIHYPLAGLRSTESQATPSLETQQATSVT